MARRVNKLNRENATLSEIEQAMKCSRTLEDFKRLQTVWYLHRGYSRDSVQELCKLADSTMRKIISQFNFKGIDGVVTKPIPGKPRKVSTEQFVKEAIPLIESPEANGFSYMSVVKLHGHLTEQLNYELSYSTVLRYVHDCDFALKVPRPQHPDQSPELRSQFVKQLSEELSREDTEVWFSDEAGVDGDPRTGRGWFKKGSKPRVAYDGCHLRQSIIGAVQPQLGVLEALAVPYTDTAVFQIFVDQLAGRTKLSNKRIVLVLDNASWHHAAKFNWHHITPMYLPPYSPDLNPIERVWLVLKNRYFTNWYTRDPDKLMSRVCEAIKSLMDSPSEISSICSVS